EVRSLAAQLESNVGSFESKKCRGAPSTSKMLACAASDRTPTEVAPDTDRELQNGRNHNHAFGLVEQLLWNPVGDVHDFLEHLATGFEAFLFPAFIRCERRTS